MLYSETTCVILGILEYISVTSDFKVFFVVSATVVISEIFGIVVICVVSVISVIFEDSNISVVLDLVNSIDSEIVLISMIGL